MRIFFRVSFHSICLAKYSSKYPPKKPWDIYLIVNPGEYITAAGKYSPNQRKHYFNLLIFKNVIDMFDCG